MRMTRRAAIHASGGGGEIFEYTCTGAHTDRYITAGGVKYRLITITGSGTFTPLKDAVADIWIAGAGGGGGGANVYSGIGALGSGGGGGGGYVNSRVGFTLVSGTQFIMVVGAGGAGGQRGYLDGTKAYYPTSGSAGGACGIGAMMTSGGSGGVTVKRQSSGSYVNVGSQGGAGGSGGGGGKQTASTYGTPAASGTGSGKSMTPFEDTTNFSHYHCAGGAGGYYRTGTTIPYDHTFGYKGGSNGGNSSVQGSAGGSYGGGPAVCNGTFYGAGGGGGCIYYTSSNTASNVGAGYQGVIYIRIQEGAA